MTIVDNSAVIGIFYAPHPDRMLRVGTLVRSGAGVMTFIVDDDYIGLGPERPLVSVSWKGATEEETVRRLTSRRDKVMRGGLLPAFFGNMLPEGALRELVEKEFGTGRFDDFDVLSRLGEDLPGAIVARRETADDTAPKARKAAETPGLRPKVRFSLAGIQLKFSMRSKRNRLTVPAQHELGDIILKIPSEQHSGLPEAEFAAMTLIKAVGVDVPEFSLVDVGAIEGIPEEFLKGGPKALAIRRFDRANGGQRIHIEDFAQILGAIGDQKYTLANDETVINIIRRFASDPRSEILDGVRRLVCNLMLGNGDAHIKNWSFIYPDDGSIRLTPAYDVVPTFLYGDNTMALAFGGTRTPENVNLRGFERLAGFLKVETKVVTKEVERTFAEISVKWPKLLNDMPLPANGAERIVKRWDTLTFVKELRERGP